MIDTTALRTQWIEDHDRLPDIGDCTCLYSCADDPAEACSLSGEWHVHPQDERGVTGACPLHPDAPGDL